MEAILVSGIPSDLAATLILSLYLLLPGFLIAGLVNLADFWRRSLAEKLLWSVVISYPVSTLIGVLLGHFIGPRVAQPVFLFIAAASIWMGLVQYRRGRLSPKGSPPSSKWPFVLLFAAISFFCLVAVTPVLVSGHLLEGVFTNDWYIRLPLQHISAVSATVPPVNPFYTLAGRSPELRYYYFFYVLCAEPMRLVSLGPRAVLAASVLWGAVNYFAVGWLMLRYLVLPGTFQFSFAARSPATRTLPSAPLPSTLSLESQRLSIPAFRWQRQALLFVLVSVIAGLDLIPNLLAISLGGRLYPTLFWWNPESISAWPGVLPFAPHHIFGLSCAMLGYLLLSAFAISTERTSSNTSSLGAPVLAGICFAAALGTSSFLAATAMAASLILGLDALLRRRWRAALAVAGTVALAILLDASFMVQTILHHGATTVSGNPDIHRYPLKLVLRFWHFSYGLTWSTRFPVYPFAQNHGLRDDILCLPMLITLYAIDLGFFAFVLWYQVRQDLPRRHHLTPQSRALWILFLTCSTFCLCISSAPMQLGLNDFGRHNSFLMHFLLMLWACPLVTAAWQRWRSGAQLPKLTRVAFVVAVFFACLGLAGDGWDITAQRLYLPLVDRGLIRPREPFIFPPGFALRYTALRDAAKFINLNTPSDALLQYNPDGILQRPVRLYLQRRVAAGDVACESGFGGDPIICRQMIVRPLLSLYAQPSNGSIDLSVQPDSSLGHFVAVCSDLHLTALIVTDYDVVWQQAGSWVWKEPVLFTSPYVRVLACPSR